ncbi:MAG: hypothetical protein IJ158_10370 [Treponema sp.]|nr:hypothetical protein [Treponema sp.]
MCYKTVQIPTNPIDWDESAEATEPSTAESSKDAFSESESTVTVSETKEEN